MSSNFKRSQPGAQSDREQNYSRNPESDISSNSSLFGSPRPTSRSKFAKSTAKTAGACALSLFGCATVAPRGAQAKSQHSPHQSAEASHTVGAAGWISGGETYIRARPGTTTPPVAKVSKHSQLHVWGKYNGWYRVETPDHIFGWVYNSYVNVPQIGKLAELSHGEARSAADHNENETMYGSPDLLRRHYIAYHAIGAAKGLHQQGIQPPKLAIPKLVSAAKHATPHPAMAHVTLAMTHLTPKHAVAKIAVQPVAHRSHHAGPVHLMPTTISQDSDSSFLDKIVKERNDGAEPRSDEAMPAANTEAPTAVAPVVPKPIVALNPIVTPEPFAAPKHVTASVLKPHHAIKAVLPHRQAVHPRPVQIVAPVPVAPVVGATQAPVDTITPDDLMKARQQFLTPSNKIDNTGAGANANQAAPDVSATTAPAASTSPRMHPTKTPAPHATVHSTAVPYRGGSPRDRVRYAINGDFGQHLASRALTFQGTPYVFGSSSPDGGFDCSGFVCYLLRAKGYNPPRSSSEFASYGTRVPDGHLRPGDIVLFANTYRQGISHVGIYIGNNKFVHAANPGRGVCINSLNDAYYAGHYYGARRVK